MKGTVSIVTGASRGIGKGIAMELAKAGSTVYITGACFLPPCGAVFCPAARPEQPQGPVRWGSATDHHCCSSPAGRTLVSTDKAPGSMQEAADEITAQAALSGNSGSCIPVICDHADDAATEALFQQVATEQDGQLDVLINNAVSAHACFPPKQIDPQAPLIYLYLTLSSTLPFALWFQGLFLTDSFCFRPAMPSVRGRQCHHGDRCQP